ncbi:MAG: tRNA uridine-5-carboxymethylaminomethyl(34) synthesis GTPase MnmE [Bacilli bacterium]|nr:tRNA uridine-5-carboxymethylaminomethyl(34) synthesis GTPase MnmE [Bacilli bacterium]
MDDNIVAIATSLGVGAISIIRLSGKEVIKITNSIFKGKNLERVNSHTINYGYIVDQEEVIDEVLVSVMKAPKTYTKEDIIEINCHGGIATTNRILELILTKDVRLAEPGEFTKRAFLNGRIDLTESEAVMDLLESKTESARHLAISNIQGKTHEMVEDFRNRLKDLLSSIEVNIDYPEYHDIEIITVDKIKGQVKQMKQELEIIIKESKNTKVLKEGIYTLIIGRPNVGKSSLLNQFLEEEKAIVTNIPGTTRDMIEGQVILNGISLNMIDTAGVRKTTDQVEKIGVEKSLSLIKQADLVIVVLNGSEALTKEDQYILEKTKEKNTIVVINKNDLEQKLKTEKLNDFTLVSTNTNHIKGIQPLKDKIIELFELDKISSKDYIYFSNIRQISKAKEAHQKLIEVEEGIENKLPIDMIEIDLKACFDFLGEIIGKTYSDEIIDHLFEKFCVGK